MISEYGGKEKYASKEEQKKHEAKETVKKEKTEQEPVKKKIVLGKPKIDYKDMHRTDNEPIGTVKKVPTEKDLKKVQSDTQKKIVLSKKKEEPKNEEGRTAAQEKEYMEELNEQVRMAKESDERYKKTPVGMMIEAKKAENKGNLKEARRLFEAAKKAGLRFN